MEDRSKEIIKILEEELDRQREEHDTAINNAYQLDFEGKDDDAFIQRTYASYSLNVYYVLEKILEKLNEKGFEVDTSLFR